MTCPLLSLLLCNHLLLPLALCLALLVAGQHSNVLTRREWGCCRAVLLVLVSVLRNHLLLRVTAHLLGDGLELVGTVVLWLLLLHLLLLMLRDLHASTALLLVCSGVLVVVMVVVANEGIASLLGAEVSAIAVAASVHHITAIHRVASGKVIVLIEVATTLAVHVRVSVVIVVVRLVLVMSVMPAISAIHITLGSLTVWPALESKLNAKGVGLRRNSVLLMQCVNCRLGHCLCFISYPSTPLGASLMVSHNFHF